MTQGSELNPVRISVSQWLNCSCVGESALCFDTHNKTSFLYFPSHWTGKYLHQDEGTNELYFFSQAKIIQHFLPLMFWMELLYLTPTEDFHHQELILQMVFFLQILSHINTETDISINRKRLAWQFNVDIDQSFVYYFGLSVCPQWTGTNRKG